MNNEQFTQIKQYLYNYLIKPRSQDPDAQRRELILNILLTGLLCIEVVALAVTLSHHFSSTVYHSTASLVSTLAATGITVLLLWVSRRGTFRAVAYVFVLFLLLLATMLMASWGFSLPIAELAAALAIVVAGILLGARTGLLITIISAGFVMVIGYLQLHQYTHADWQWLHEPFNIGDAISYASIFAIIGLVSWLANREIDASLGRARRSEAALAKERDNLELKVRERTQQLERTQFIRLTELQRFAEFGKLSANLLHEVSNPLTAAAINLEQLDDIQHSSLVLQARQSLQHLERYVDAARKQLKGQATITTFSIKSELQHVEHVLRPVAQKARVKLIITENSDHTLSGDAVKFNQLVANVILNAIEAYGEPPASKPGNRIVTVDVAQDNQWLIITVSDHGKGIKPGQLTHLFEPFYSTKPQTSRGMGIGLTMVKQFIEEDFNGDIRVTSDKSTGTSFIIRLRGKRP